VLGSALAPALLRGFSPFNYGEESMTRYFVIAVLVSLFTFGVAGADRDRWRAGTEGTVTAYEADGRTVIENKQCFKTRRYGGYDYVSCGRRLRSAVKLELCRRGGGTHTWWYQIGDKRPMRSSVYCRR
jgi:hypothetical protein